MARKWFLTCLGGGALLALEGQAAELDGKIGELRADIGKNAQSEAEITAVEQSQAR